MKKVLLILAVFALFSFPIQAQQKSTKGVKTVVIDAGHGGKAPGASGLKYKEKNIVLNVAKKLGKLIEQNYRDVKVVYTRTTDTCIDLSERGDIANKAKGDLFISIHANACPTSGPHGVETYVVGLSKRKINMEVARKENADILQEKNYQTNEAYRGIDVNSTEASIIFSMLQNQYLNKSIAFASLVQEEYKASIPQVVDRGVQQAELAVLVRPTMPAILTEIGFISNEQEEKYIGSEAGQNTIARCLFNAFSKYKAKEEGTNANILVAEEPHSNLVESEPEPAPEAVVEEVVEEVAAEVKAVVNSELPNSQAPSTVAINDDLEANAEYGTSIPSDDANAAVIDTSSKRIESPSITQDVPVLFRVQILVSSHELDKGDKEFKGLDNYEMYRNGSNYCYVWGKATSLDAAKALQSEVKQKGFADAFVVAFSKGKRISIQEAIELTK